MATSRSQLTVSTKALLLGAVLFCICVAARAQGQQTPAAQPAPQATEAVQPPQSAQPPPAPSTAPATAPEQPAPSVAPSADPVPAGVALDPAAAALARQHWLMRARAQRAQAERGEEPEPSRMHGDAGAPFALGIGGGAQWHDDASYDLFDDDDVEPAFALWLAYDVLALGESAFLAAELGWELETQESDDLLGSTLESSLNDHSLTAGVQLRFVPLAMFQPHLRLAGGASIVGVELRTPAGESFEDDGVAPIGSAGVGFTLRTPTRMFETRKGQLASLSFGLMFEAGYTLAGSVPLALDGEGPAERDIPITESELGKLSGSGPYLRASLVTRL